MGRRACRPPVPNSGAKQSSRKAPGWSYSGVAEVLALVRISLGTPRSPPIETGTAHGPEADLLSVQSNQWQSHSPKSACPCCGLMRPWLRCRRVRTGSSVTKRICFEVRHAFTASCLSLGFQVAQSVSPNTRPTGVGRQAVTNSHSILGGLHHQYARV
jgi:hypothetical protein